MYTSHGYMTSEDYLEHLRDTDQGSTTIDVADWPAGWPRPGVCPICGDPLSEMNHDSVRAADASGEIYACLPIGSVWTYVTTEGGQ